MTATALRRAAVATLLTAAATLAVAGEASAASSQADLQIVAQGTPGWSRWEATGTIVMSQADAQRVVSGGKLVARLWGEDPASDDLIQGPLTSTNQTSPGTMQVTATGVTFRVWAQLRTSSLNEDQPGEDDIYVGIRAFDAQGREINNVRTETDHGYY